MRNSPQYKWFLKSLREDQLEDFNQGSINQQKDWYISYLEDHYAKADRDRFDKIQAMTTGYGKGWVMRLSGSSRGLRLHESSRPEAVESVRMAIDKFFKSKSND